MLQIILFELSYRMRRPATYGYFLILFLMSLLFASTDAVMIGGGVGQVFKNAPYTINQVTMIMCVFGTFIISAMMGVPVFRDFDHRFHEIMFATPIRKWQYLGGRFIGSYIVTVGILSGIILGIWVGQYMPWADAAKFGPTKLIYYIQPFINYILPNTLLLGAIFFAAGSYFRSQLAIYVQGIVVFAFYLVISQLMGDADTNNLYSIAEPFGLSATRELTRYWTTAEQNTQVVTLSSFLLYNRLLWTGIAAVIMLLFARFFTFSKAAPQWGRKAKASNRADEDNSAMAALATMGSALPIAHIAPSKWQQFWFLTHFYARNVWRSVPFWAITLCGIVILLLNATEISAAFGNPILPVTYAILDIVSGSFSLFMLIIITFYVGELMWKERDVQLANIIDASPLGSGVNIAAKIMAMLGVVVLLSAMLMLTGMGVQLAMGFTDLQPMLYIKYLFGYSLINWLQLIMLAFFIHSIVSNKFVGHLLMIVYYVAQIALSALEIDHNLAFFGRSPNITYSGMNGFGHWLWSWGCFNGFWNILGVMMLIAAALITQRGSENSFKARWARFIHQFRTSNAKFVLPLLGILFMVCGGFIYYNTNVLNPYRTPKAQKALRALYETNYKKYQNIAQPRITAVKINMDLFPETRQYAAKGTYTLINKTQVPIDSVHVQIGEELMQVKQLAFSVGAKEVLFDKPMGYRIFKLDQALQPNDSIALNFDLLYAELGFPNDGGTSSITYNGTFINSGVLPSIGYSENYELNDDDDRRKNNLPKRETRMKPPTDTLARMNTYIATDSDWITFDATVSTTPSQIAVAPGYLQREWTENNRRYFHYKMDKPILNFYSFLSADYQVMREKWNGIDLEIYYQQGHEYNLERMMKGMKLALDYCGKNFSPYQHRQARILEFPRYATFAQSFPNTIPFSEGIGFILDIDEETGIDMPLYVTAHEIAHQWWAHQVIGGNVQGCTLMSETMAQYSSLMVMEQEYGKEKMQKFLKYELDSYLRGRANENKAENPLMYNENQPYIHYNKGSLVMYALKDYLGEAHLNQAISNYVKKVAYQDAPFTTSLEFVAELRQATPDTLQYLIKDLFETITLYNNRTEKATYTTNADGTYSLDLSIETKKIRSDEKGNETAADMNDWIDIGVYAKGKGEEDTLIYLQKHQLKAGKTSLTLPLKQLPTKAGIDPLHILIDRDSDDNVKKVEVVN
jgi:ABC-2 type transport system permease protein